MSSLWFFRIVKIAFFWFIIYWSVTIYFSWNLTGCISWDEQFCSISFMVASSVNSVDVFFWFLSSKNYQKENWDFFPIFLFIAKWNNWYLFYLGCWYSTMNTTTFFHFPPIIISSVRSLFCCSIMMIVLTSVINIRLVILCILLSKISIVGTWRFIIIPITFWFNSTIAVWSLLYKN